MSRAAKKFPETGRDLADYSDENRPDRRPGEIKEQSGADEKGDGTFEEVTREQVGQTSDDLRGDDDDGKPPGPAPLPEPSHTSDR